MFSVQTVYMISRVLLQDNVLNIINQIMDECIPHERANRDFCVKFPEEIRHDNLAGQLWFGAEVGLSNFCSVGLIDTLLYKATCTFSGFSERGTKIITEQSKQENSLWVLREMGFFNCGFGWANSIPGYFHNCALSVFYSEKLLFCGLASE